ncbi:unnamed protein product [Hyaloperonospora brassicae]|uniref:Uncharacterized protein n=1 Tax=Hyaloperonospora brassicae TaxID=162125 RepID=A0AAV0U4I4_HYABA|nr:unnamed protein product [Hyaloperonospora brassicae]CAI5730578.1 unnamed protein product [Hyaloperonospora brassicae]
MHDDSAAGPPLAAHFEAKRRILATVKQLQDRGETIEEATSDEVAEAVCKSAATVFRFDFCLSATAKEKTRHRTRKRAKKRRAKRLHDTTDSAGDQKTARTSCETRDAVPQREEHRTDAQLRRVDCGQLTRPKEERLSSSVAVSPFVKLRKATGTESEVATMHLRYGQGRRNLAATKQRAQRRKALNAATTTATATATTATPAATTTTTSDFRFNFLATS